MLCKIYKDDGSQTYRRLWYILRLITDDDLMVELGDDNRNSVIKRRNRIEFSLVGDLSWKL